MKKIAILTTVCPYPKNVGKHVFLGGIFDYLLADPGVDLHVYSFMPFSVPIAGTVAVLKRPRMAEVLLNLVWLVAIRRQMSIQEAFFWSRETHAQFENALEKLAPDMVLYDTIRAEQYASRSKKAFGLVYTYLEDLFSVRYERVLAASTKGMSADRHVLGNFADKLPSVARAAFDRSAFLRRSILKFEMKALMRSEQRAFQRSDKCLLISATEVAVGRARDPGARIEEIPPRMNGEKTAVREWDGKAEFVFLGSLKLAHNITAVEWFIEHCLPIVLATTPGFVFRIIGTGGSDKLDALRAAYPDNVVQMGFVESMEPYLLSACALIAPLLFGSGVKIKVIDALRCGLPVVSSAVGAEGIHGVEAGAIVLAEGAQGFAAAVDGMLSIERNRAASAAALAVFDRYYSEPSTQQRYGEIFDLQPAVPA